VRRTAPFLTAVLLALSFLTFYPAPPDSDVDSSLSDTLSYAHQQGIQFGTDFVFTYGPLGYLMFFYYTPHAAGLRAAVAVALCLVTATGLSLVAWRLRPLARWLLLLLFFWIAPNLPARTDLLIYCGLLCWGLLCFLESGRRLQLYGLIFVLLAAFGALAKVSFLFVTIGSVALVACDVAVRGRWRLALAVVGGYAGGFVAGWLAARQELIHAGAYLANGLKIVEGYNGALGWEGLALLRTLALMLVPVVLAMILLRTMPAFEAGEPHRAARRGLLSAWLLSLSFALWKYGCVRMGREVVLLGFLSVLAFGLGTLPCQRPTARLWARGLAVGLVAVALVTMQVYSFEGWPRSLWQPLRGFARNLAWLVHPAEYRRQMDEVIAANRRQAQLPRCRELIGAGRMDVFGHWQSYALHNDLNYHPRPVFQSYVACSRPLMQLNEQFYASKSAPEYMLFRLFGLDEKYPPLEDAPVLRTLLANYAPLTTEETFILLKRTTTEPPRLSLAREGTVPLGQPIDLREFGDTDLWLEIVLQPSWLGRLRQVLYRPPTVRFAAWREPGGKAMVRRRAPAPMLAAGFLASPLLLKNNDVLNLYANRSIWRPGACGAEVVPGEECYWQERVRYRIYKLESPLGRCTPADAAKRLREPSAASVSGLASPNPPATAHQSEPARALAIPGSVVQPGTNSARPFVLFRPSRWRLNSPAPEDWEQNLTLGLFLAAPIISFALLALFVRKVKASRVPAGWTRLAVGNTLVLLSLVTTAALVGEVYFRFWYDTTDSLAFTRVSERWVQRHWHLNGAGCRDNVEYSPRLVPGKRRITFVGDSFTAGHGIKDVEDRFPNRLRRAHPDWEIHVLASVGLDTGGELALMKKALAKGYQVEQVVLVYCLNDIGDLMPTGADATGRVLAELDNSGWLLRNSFMMNLWYHHYRAARDPYLGNYCSFVREAYRGPLWEKQMRRLKAFRDLVEAHGGRLAVITFPFLHVLGPHYEYRFVHDQLDRLWQGLGVPHLDLLREYDGIPSGRLTVNRYDAHPNERANQLAAAAIDKWLR
jgi:hypothetical protein